MNRLPRLAAACAAVILCASPAAAQDSAAANVARIDVQPATVTIDVEDTTRLAATAYDARGAKLAVPLLFFSSSRRNVSVDQTGLVSAHAPGEYEVIVLARGDTVRGQARVSVRWPALESIEIVSTPTPHYAGTTIGYVARIMDASGVERSNVSLNWRSSNADVATIDQFGQVTARKPGSTTLTASAGGISGTRNVTIAPNPARSITIASSADGGRMGDVIHFTATVSDGSGKPISGYPVAYSLRADVEDTVIAPAAAAQVDEDGSFVAQRAGRYTIYATAGNLVAHKTVPITHRFASMRIETGKGHGAVSDVHTSDLWVWSGKDGRDYAVTGTWGAAGVAYFWDVTDPAAPTRIDSVQVDARTVNDVKVDAENGVCVISREGASSRRNGLVVLDCSNPRDVQVLSSFEEGLTGGVHNVFLWNKHVFAINAGTRYDIISLEDPKNPKRVSFFELDTPGHGIHDVWVVDGIAYSSNWGDGIVMVDVGNGMAGGSLEKPVQIGAYKYPIGATHSAFPYKSPTGKFYVFVGDEQFPYGLSPDDAAQAEAGGYIHVVDFTDVKNPKEVARYQVPEAGPHNFWVENDTLYVAYYNAGLRVVDVSGELKGELYEQGRELVRWKAFDPNGKVANTPMAWGPQPHKGHVFVSDFNSGLWSVKLPERPQPVTP
jgi:hypothetical protein